MLDFTSVLSLPIYMWIYLFVWDFFYLQLLLYFWFLFSYFKILWEFAKTRYVKMRIGEVLTRYSIQFAGILNRLYLFVWTIQNPKQVLNNRWQPMVLGIANMNCIQNAIKVVTASSFFVWLLAFEIGATMQVQCIFRIVKKIFQHKYDTVSYFSGNETSRNNNNFLRRVSCHHSNRKWCSTMATAG